MLALVLACYHQRHVLVHVSIGVSMLPPKAHVSACLINQSINQSINGCWVQTALTLAASFWPDLRHVSVLPSVRQFSVRPSSPRIPHICPASSPCGPPNCPIVQSWNCQCRVSIVYKMDWFCIDHYSTGIFEGGWIFCGSVECLDELRGFLASRISWDQSGPDPLQNHSEWLGDKLDPRDAPTYKLFLKEHGEADMDSEEVWGVCVCGWVCVWGGGLSLPTCDWKLN